MDYLLDTNACIALFPGRPTAVLTRLLEYQRQASKVFVSAVVLFELHYGIEKSQRKARNELRMKRLLDLGIEVAEFDAVDGHIAARIRVDLEARKQPIGPYDTLIAGQALARGLTLVTANTREFSRVDDLLWEDWSTDAFQMG